MKEQLENRIRGLKAEFDSGQKMLAELEEKQANLRTTLLRISGAIHMLEEELEKAKAREGEEDILKNTSRKEVEE